ncbi:MAG: PKD domain-containing protein [Chitinophagaceae bacterium]
MKKTFTILSQLFFLIVFSCSLSYSQQSNIWYFGSQSGLDFNPPTNPVTSIPFALNNSAMIANEGSSSYCDDNGNLLFYTNGATVYNQKHVQMVNGDNIGGHISSFQSSLIIPHPGNKDLFYIFTSDAFETSFMNGYRFSMVDMSGDNGNGIVISKNNLLDGSCTERLAACRHANGQDVWLITNENNSNIFRSWLIDCNGLSTIPVISTIGDLLNNYATINVGTLKVSPDGKQICQTHYPDIDLPIGINPSNFIQLFDFDNNSGVLSNVKKIAMGSKAIINSEYSSNSSLLYLTSNGFIDQVKCKLPTSGQILGSLVSFPSTKGIYGMQLGPDGKIYLSASTTSLDVINFPDNEGLSCNYRPGQLNLLKPSMLGLPSFINDISFDPYNNFSFQVLDSCNGVVQFFGLSNSTGNIAWSWDFGDGVISDIQNPVHTYVSASQSYHVSLKISYQNNCGSKIKIENKIISPAGVLQKPDFKFYGGCDSGYIRFENINPLDTNAGKKYIWYFGDGSTSNEINPKHIYTGPGFYNVKLKLKTTTGCLDDSISRTIDMITFSGNVIISDEKSIFAGQSVKLFAKGPGNHFEWSPSAGLNNPLIAAPTATPLQTTTYKIKNSNDAGCFLEKSVKITVVELDDIFVPTGFTPNNDGKNDLLLPIMGSKFLLKEFSVYNRWGQKVFTTAQSGIGWNGTHKGVVLDSGIYIWIMKATDASGKNIERKGTAALIR